MSEKSGLSSSLAYFTEHHDFQANPLSYKQYDLTICYDWVILHWVHLPHSLYPFICWLAPGLTVTWLPWIMLSWTWMYRHCCCLWLWLGIYPRVCIKMQLNHMAALLLVFETPIIFFVFCKLAVLNLNVVLTYIKISCVSGLHFPCA